MLKLKPGWYALFALALYALVTTLAWWHSNTELHRLRAALVGVQVSGAAVGESGKYRLPLPGACLPQKPKHLPGYPRDYRRGVNQGFIFTNGDACVPVVYGAGVVADQGGRILKAEQNYKELTPARFSALLEAVADGATPEEMDKLRGREIWIEHPDGRISVYAHLAGIRPGLREGDLVKKGEWIGYLGNSGTQAAVNGSHEGARLLLEVWKDAVDRGVFLGQGLDPHKDAGKILARARALFEVP
jgi:hypothetical protein